MTYGCESHIHCSTQRWSLNRCDIIFIYNFFGTFPTIEQLITSGEHSHPLQLEKWSYTRTTTHTHTIVITTDVSIIQSQSKWFMIMTNKPFFLSGFANVINKMQNYFKYSVHRDADEYIELDKQRRGEKRKKCVKTTQHQHRQQYNILPIISYNLYTSIVRFNWVVEASAHKFAYRLWTFGLRAK